MLNKLLVLSLFSIISFPVFSETYVCSQELTRFDQQGEIETLTIERDGHSFKGKRVPSPMVIRFQISHESKSNLILTEVDDYSPLSLSIIFINKDTKEWGMSYLTMEEFKRDPPDPLSYGKCTVVN